jgi:hypothetical protein
MANRFSQNFTLLDIFNNKKLRNKIPLINYREKELENGKISRRTNAKTVNRQVFETAKSSARPFYTPMVASQSGDKLIIGGELRINSELEDVVDAVYNGLLAKKQILIFTANNADMIRDALKEAEKNRRNYGIQCKLYLRVQSMQQIEGMTEKQVAYLMNDIMENIVYSDDFIATQKKWNVQEMAVKSPYTYEQRKEQWQQKVGIK